jgi:hypothetical protein
MPNSNDFQVSDLPSVLLPGLDLLRRIGRRAAAGVGFIDAYVSIVPLPLAFVKSQLPPGLSLRELPRQSQTHDVVLIFAHQSNVRPGFLPFGGLDYAEVFQVIPNVELSGSHPLSDAQYSYMPHLLLDHLAPVIVGQAAYGFSKQLASIRTGDNSFEVRSAFGAMAAQFLPTGLPGDISEFSAISDLRSRLQLPLVGVARDGSFLFSILNFNLDGATFQSIKGTIKAGLPFLPDSESLKISDDPSTKSWGFKMESEWSLSLPIGDVARKTPVHAQHARALTAGYSRAMFGRVPFRR